MIKQRKDYIQNKKKHHLIRALIWGSIVLIIFGIGLAVMSTRESKFTLVAALFVLPFGLHLTRYFSYAKYKDPGPKEASVLEHMKGTYTLYHSVIIPDSTTTFYFEHVVVTSRNIYFITKDEEGMSKAKPILNLRLKSKGLAESQLRYIHGSDLTAIKNASLKIQKDACFSDEQLGNNTKIIDAIIM